VLYLGSRVRVDPFFRVGMSGAASDAASLLLPHHPCHPIRKCACVLSGTVISNKTQSVKRGVGGGGEVELEGVHPFGMGKQ
jgi:hypothetical protein